LFACLTVGVPHPCAAQSDAADEPAAERFHVEFATMWWFASPEIELQTSSFDLPRPVNFTDEFGLKAERFSDIRVVGKPGRKHRIRFSYVPIRYDGSRASGQPFVFGDEVFVGPASASIRWDLWRFGYQWNFVTRSRGLVGVIGELKYNDIDAAASAAVSGSAQKVKAPVPTVGIAARVYPHPAVAISGELTGIKIPGESFGGSMFDFDVSATANLGRHFGVQGGFRSVSADYDIDGDRGDLAVRGMYLGVQSKF